MVLRITCVLFFFFNDTATTEIYTLSLHDALPISGRAGGSGRVRRPLPQQLLEQRSEEHTSELQSPPDLVCRLLLEKKKSTTPINATPRPSQTPTQQKMLAGSR